MIEDLQKQLDSIRGQLSIDPNSLEEECVHQPVLYEQVGVLYSEAKAAAKIAKEHTEYEKARIKADIRKNPSNYGLGKVTEDSVEEAVIVQDAYQTALKDSIESQRVADILGVLLEATSQRKSVLKDLVSLYVYNYYSGNVGDTNQEIKRLSKMTEQELLEKGNQLASRRQDEDTEV